jgi:hypothetical protein
MKYRSPAGEERILKELKLAGIDACTLRSAASRAVTRVEPPLGSRKTRSTPSKGAAARAKAKRPLKRVRRIGNMNDSVVETDAGAVR